MATLDDIEAAFATAGAALPERMARSLGNRYFLKNSDLRQIGYICFFFRETPLRGILPNRPSLLGQKATPKTVHKHDVNLQSVTLLALKKLDISYISKITSKGL